MLRISRDPIMNHTKPFLLYLGNFITHPEINPTFSFVLAQALRGWVPVQTVGASQSRIRRLLQMLDAVLRGRRPRLVLIDGYATKAFWFMVILERVCSWRNIPCFLLLHSGDWPQRWTSHPRVSRKAFSGAAAVLCTSQFLYDRLPFARDKAQVVHNFVHLDQYEFQLRKRFSGRVLWVREFHPRYGDDMALAIAQNFAEQEIEITMVGPGVDAFRARWPQRPANLHLIAKLTPEEWHQLAREFDLFLNTSVVDSFPLTLLEAQALGIPVLSTPTGGIPELVKAGVNGWLAPTEDAMVDQLREILRYPHSIEAISKSAREDVQQFDWTVIAPKWKTLLNPYFVL